jgi:branched-chain amino acid transport system permease protein
LPELFRGFGDFRLVLYGATLTLVVLFMPGGIAQAARILRRRVASFHKPAQMGFGQ